MVRLQKRPDEDDSRLLLNENGRLSDCVCCCDGLPSTLYLHVIAQHDNSSCENVDYGTESIAVGSYSVSLNIQDSCIDWETDTQGGGDPLMQCFDGSVGQDFGINVRLHCQPTNQFRLDICWGQFGHPDEDFSNCTELLSGLAPSNSVTCEAEPGEFYLDFGNFVPMASTAASCLCEFWVYIDENPDPVRQQNNIFWFPAESSDAFGTGQLKGLAWWHENTPGLGTWLHPEASPMIDPLISASDLPRDVQEAFKWQE